MRNSVNNTASKVININTYLIAHVPKTLMNKEVSKNFKHIDPFVNSIKNFTLAAVKALSNTQNNPIPSVDY